MLPSPREMEPAAARFFRRLPTAALAVAALMVGAGAGPARAQRAAPEKAPGGGLETDLAFLRQRAEASDLAHRLLASLTVEVGHRFAGSAGDRAAVAWATEAMRGLGLDAVRAEPVTVPRWVRGEAQGEILAPFPQELVLIALGGSVGTPEEGVVAEVVEVADLDALAALPGDRVAGRIVFFNLGMERRRDGAGYGPVARIRRNGAARAAEKGAVAMLMRSAGTGPHRFAHTGSLRYAEGVAPIPAAALALPDADLLAAQLAGGRPVTARLRLTSRTLPDTLSANVIGEVRGRELPDEVVLLSAHLDSWDVGTGAVDDGSGCAIVMAAAKLIAELARPPRRTVRVVLFANEEFGLSGARAYAAAYAVSLARHQLALESDFGAGRVWRFAARVHPDRAPLAEAFSQRWLAPLGIEWGGTETGGGADLIPLRPERVPLADLIQDGTFYFDVHHTLDDTLDKVDPEALAQNVAAFALTAYWAAEIPEALGPAPPWNQP